MGDGKGENVKNKETDRKTRPGRRKRKLKEVKAKKHEENRKLEM